MKSVIVMGGNYSLTLGVTRSLGEAGYEVRLLVADKSAERIAGKSKYVTKCCNCLANSEDQKGLAILRIMRKINSLLFGKRDKKVELGFDTVWKTLELLRGNDEKILIIPVSDPYCLMLDAHAEDFAKRYFIPNVFNKQGKITHYMDKMMQKELARQCGLLTAWGKVYSTNEQGLQKAIQEVKYPCFMKVIVSATVFKGKTLYSVCKNKEELEAAIKKAQNNGCSNVLIEEFLDIEKDICIYGVAGDNKAYMPACLETLRGGLGRHKGVTVEGLITSAECLGDVRIKLEDFVKRIGLTGLFCIDLVLSKGDIYFIEMNLRSGASIYGVTLAGANLPGTLANMVYHNFYSEPLDVKRKVHFLSEMLELDTYADGFITYKEYAKHMESDQERFIRNDSDPAPWKEFQNLVFRKRIIKLIQRFCRKNTI